MHHPSAPSTRLDSQQVSFFKSSDPAYRLRPRVLNQLHYSAGLGHLYKSLHSLSGVASPKTWVGGKMFDFRRITLFCLEKRLSKHKMTIFSKNLGGHGPFSPPLALATPMHTLLLLKILCFRSMQGISSCLLLQSSRQWALGSNAAGFAARLSSLSRVAQINHGRSRCAVVMHCQEETNVLSFRTASTSGRACSTRFAQ